MKSFALIAMAVLTAACLRGQVPVTVIEEGAGPNEIVEVASSNLGYNLWVYGCIIDIEVNNQQTVGFCIDPWDWSGSGPMNYTAEALASGPKVAGGMGIATAIQIEQLWDEFWSPNISNETAAGLQIAIWDLVGASISATSDGADWFELQSSDDWGASDMIAWVDANPNAPTASLMAVSGPGQDYVVMASVIPQPPTVQLTAPATAYTGSPLTVTSAAQAPNSNLTLHSIEWLSPAGSWTVDSVSASGASDQMTLGITFPTVGNWTVRAGASVDNGVTWVYSANQQIAVTSGLTNYTLESMAVPPSSLVGWYSPSTVASQTYQVQHVNP